MIPDNVLHVELDIPIPYGRRLSKNQAARLIDAFSEAIRDLGTVGDTYLGGKVVASNGRVAVEGKTPRTERVTRRTTRKPAS